MHSSVLTGVRRDVCNARATRTFSRAVRLSMPLARLSQRAQDSAPKALTHSGWMPGRRELRAALTIGAVRVDIMLTASHWLLGSVHHLDQLNEVPTGVVEDRHSDRPGIHRLNSKLHSQIAQPFSLGIKVLNLK